MKASARKKWLLGGAAGAVGLLVLVALLGVAGLRAGGVFKVKTKDGTIVLENLPPDADVMVDGGTVRVQSSDGKTLEIRVDASKQKHRVEVKKDGFKAFGEEVEVDAGGRKSVLVRDWSRWSAPAKPMPAADDNEKPKPVAEDKAKWVSLFNGKDLQGWSVERDDPKSWAVKDGLLVAYGSTLDKLNFLLSDRDYGDFILRLEFNLDDHAGSGVILTPIPGELLPHPFGNRLSEHPVFRLEDQPTRNEVTGTLHWVLDSTHVGPKRQADLSPPGSWNTLEIEMTGRSLRASVNGKPVSDTTLAEGVLFKDGTVPALNRAKGRIGLLKHHGTVRPQDRDQGIAADPGRHRSESASCLDRIWGVENRRRGVGSGIPEGRRTALRRSQVERLHFQSRDDGGSRAIPNTGYPIASPPRGGRFSFSAGGATRRAARPRCLTGGSASNGGP